MTVQTADLVEIEAVVVAGGERLDPEVGCGDLFQGLLRLVLRCHGHRYLLFCQGFTFSSIALRLPPEWRQIKGNNGFLRLIARLS